MSVVRGPSAGGLYLCLAALLLGFPALVSALTLRGEESFRDLWQHLAAIDALTADLRNPSNPFVASDATSRHFQPFWVMGAALARVFEFSAFTIFAMAGWLTAVLMAGGVYAFARAYFRAPHAPSVLLVLLTLGWAVQLGHTGFTSLSTLLYGISYPATTLIALGFILWALVIRCLQAPRWMWLIPPLVALMMTTHQLGALIGMTVAGCFVLTRPDAAMRARLVTGVAMLLGLGLAAFWPYHNPYALVLAASNVSWEGGPDFYGPTYIIGAFVPALLGIAGLRSKAARPIALACAIFLTLYLIGAFGPKIGTRFLMPTGLMLHIGLTSVCLTQIGRLGDVARGHLWLIPVGMVGVVAAISWTFKQQSIDPRTANPTIYEAAVTLIAPLDVGAVVGAHDLAAWPVVAAGQLVHAVPWPEPGITDLAERQEAQAALFDLSLSATERSSLAARLGVDVLILDQRYAPPEALMLLQAQSVDFAQSGPLWRFDLRP